MIQGMTLFKYKGRRIESDQEAFVVGFLYGACYKEAVTPREAECGLVPTEHVDAFLNGVSDGVSGDDFRMNLVEAEMLRMERDQKGLVNRSNDFIGFEGDA